jgi:hypothetical protein
VLFSAIAIGSELGSPGAAQSKLGISLISVIAIYFVAALGIGLVVVRFAAWANSRLRGTLLGFIAAMLLGLALSPMILLPMSPAQLLKALILFGLLLGAPVGAMYWKPPEKE